MALTKVQPIMTTMETTEEKTWYVNASSGSDTNDGTTAGTAFQTIQHAIDQLPPIIKHQQTIQLADGIYNTSSRAAADMPRPAIVYPQGKVISQRTAQDGSDLEGMIVIKGTTKAGTIVQNNTASGYTYAVYVSRCEIAMQDLTIQADTSGAAANSLLTVHRSGYAQCRRVDFNGQSNATFGVIAESGSIAELSGCNISDCTNGASAIGEGDSIVFSHQDPDGVISGCTTGLTGGLGGQIAVYVFQPSLGDVAVITGNTFGARNTSDARLFLRGESPTSRVLVEDPIYIENGGVLDTVWVAFDTSIFAENADVKLNTSDFQSGIQLNNSNLWINNCNSYIAPATANDSNKPIDIRWNSGVYYEGTNNIVGLASQPAFRGGGDLLFTANSQTVAADPYYDSFRITGGTVARTGCQIDSTGVEEGRILYVTGDTWDVELIGSGTHMEFDTDFSIGTSTASYSGAVFMMQNGKWRLVSLGEVRT
jgi:hypothetical protein